MRRFVITLMILPLAVMLSTLLLSWLYQFVPLAMRHSWSMTVLELGVPAGLVWLVTRHAWPRWAWYRVVRACGAGIVWVALALGVALATDMLAFAPTVRYDALLSFIAVALPLAWWCMAEEVVLRVLLPGTLVALSPWLRGVLMWLVAAALMWVLSTPASWYTVLVLGAGELLGVVTWASAGDFGQMWARRWVWRWVMVAGCGATQLGLTLAVPAPVTLVIPEALVPAIVTVGALFAWSSWTVGAYYAQQRATRMA